MAQFYNNTAVTPRDIDFVRHSIAKAANIADPEWIHPSDRLLKDLGPWRFDELGTVELVMAMEEALGTEIRNREAERFVTVDDLIRRLSNRPRTPRA